MGEQCCTETKKNKKNFKVYYLFKNVDQKIWTFDTKKLSINVNNWGGGGESRDIDPLKSLAKCVFTQRYSVANFNLILTLVNVSLF